MRVTAPSTWSWLDHSVSGLPHATNRPIQTRFPCGSDIYILTSQHTSNSLDHYAKGTPSLNKLAPTACKHTVSGSISLPFSGYFSPFPHGTSSLSVSQEYLALPDGSGEFIQNFTCSALLRILLFINADLRLRDCHPLWLHFPMYSTS